VLLVDRKGAKFPAVGGHAGIIVLSSCTACCFAARKPAVTRETGAGHADASQKVTLLYDTKAANDLLRRVEMLASNRPAANISSCHYVVRRFSRRTKVARSDDQGAQRLNHARKLRAS